MAISLYGLILLVGSAVGYSALDLLRKKLVVRMRAAPLLFLLSLLMVPFFALWMELAQEVEVARGYWAPGLGSVALNVVANLLFLEAVRLSPLSVTIPFLSLSPVFTALLGIPLLGEVPSVRQFAGIALVVVGAFRINLPGGARGSRQAMRAFRGEAGSVMMAAVALLWSLAAPLDKIAMSHASPPFHGLVLNAGLAVALLALLTGQRRLREIVPPPGSGALLAWSVVASVGALGLLLVAFTVVWVGLAEAVRRALGSVLSLALGHHVFGEQITVNKKLGVLLMMLGIALILL